MANDTDTVSGDNRRSEATAVTGVSARRLGTLPSELPHSQRHIDRSTRDMAEAMIGTKPESAVGTASLGMGVVQDDRQTAVVRPTRAPPSTPGGGAGGALRLLSRRSSTRKRQRSSSRRASDSR